MSGVDDVNGDSGDGNVGDGFDGDGFAMTPPDGDIVDASDFWAKRNRPADTESQPAARRSSEDVAESAPHDESGTRAGENPVPTEGGWIRRYADYLDSPERRDDEGPAAYASSLSVEFPGEEVIYGSNGPLQTFERAPSGWIPNGGATGSEPLSFKRLLVANRGEIALRVFRTARESGIETVAVFSDPDRNAAHVRGADIAVALGGTTSTESYLDTAKILDAARRSGADAIHPGYGFLSENAEFAEAVAAAGLTWVGPTPTSIRSMALKVEAKRIAETAGVPLVPGAELSGDIDDVKLAEIAEGVGYPLLVKASAGGGGKGMRVINAPAELSEAVETARREALNSFGDPTVFFERYLTGARHVEVQVFGDTHGNVVHLFERECSIQRRHQKIVEESPSPGATAATLERMYAAATSLTSAIGYVGAGTVEFLVFGEGEYQEFYFLEMNTRLQVEHPVTEAVTGIDLVAWQLQVASGNPLPMPQDQITRWSHAIEVRLYAEDPANNYLPSTGTLHAFGRSSVPASGGQYCREDSGFEPGDDVSPYYDPMLAKIISTGDSRDEAASALAAHLRELQIAGVTTNRDSLIAILESDAFAAGATTTDFLETNTELLSQEVLNSTARGLFLMAATIAESARAQHSARWASLTYSGWRNIPSAPQRTDWEFDVAGESRAVTAAFVPTGDSTGRIVLREQSAEAGFSGEIEGIEYRIALGEFDDEFGPWTVYRIELDGVGRNYSVQSAGGYTWVSDGRNSATFRRLPRFADPDVAGAAGGSTAPVPGTVVSVEVSEGDEVTEGQTLVVLEAMKMEHRITAAADGTVAEVHVTPGTSVDAHQILVTLA